MNGKTQTKAHFFFTNSPTLPYLIQPKQDLHTDLFESLVVFSCDWSGAAVIETGDDRSNEGVSQRRVSTTLLIESAVARFMLGP